MQDILKEEQRRLKSMVRRIDRDLHREGQTLEAGRGRVQSHAKASRWEQARRAAIELHRSRLAFDRLGSQKDNVERVADKIKQQMNAVAIDQSMVMVTRVMSARLQVMHPERFAKLMLRYEELKAKEEMNEEQLNDFFSASEDHELERVQEDGRTDDQRVALIFAELGIATAPDVPRHQPESLVNNPKSGGGTTGGGSGTISSTAPLPAADADDTLETSLMSRLHALQPVARDNSVGKDE